MRSKLNPHVRRTDKNQAEIVSALRNLGAHVACTHTVGHGFPDLVVAFGNRLTLLEVKSDGGKLTADEQKFSDEWHGYVDVVRSVEEAINVVLYGG